jgi:hypothetical protein
MKQTNKTKMKEEIKMDNKKMLQKENLNWLYANQDHFTPKQFTYLLKDLMGQNDKLGFTAKDMEWKN